MFNVEEPPWKIGKKSERHVTGFPYKNGCVTTNGKLQPKEKMLYTLQKIVIANKSQFPVNYYWWQSQIFDDKQITDGDSPTPNHRCKSIKMGSTYVTKGVSANSWLDLTPADSTNSMRTCSSGWQTSGYKTFFDIEIYNGCSVWAKFLFYLVKRVLFNLNE